jgi:hypothetical protein
LLEFFLFILILFSAAWGSAFLYQIIGKFSRIVEPGNEEMGDSRLREEVENLAGRLGRVEDELEFYKQLRAPEEPDS